MMKTTRKGQTLKDFKSGHVHVFVLVLVKC